jgi:Zn-dependent protease
MLRKTPGGKSEGLNMNPSGDDHTKPEPVEGEYLAPDPHPASGRNWGKTAGGGILGLGLLAAKFKGLLLVLLNLKYALFFGKFALSGFSFLASIWLYVAWFGWKFGVAFALLILLHEAGHAVFVRGYGLSVPNIYFLPGLGAFTSFTGTYTPYQEATIAFGGPLFGTIGGLVCLAYGAATNEPFWFAVAYTTFFLNAFNMIPLGFFDGRITGAISPKLWIGGLVVVAAAAIGFHWWNPIVLLVLALSIPRTISAWRGNLDARYASVTAQEKTKIGLAYFGLLAVALGGLALSHVVVPNHTLFAS